MLLFAYYLLKVIACSAILFAYYWFFLRNKVFHTYNRFYLLALIVLSLSAPLMKINFWQYSEAPKTSVIKMLQAVNNSDEYMDEVIIHSNYQHFDKAEIALIIFVLLSFLMALIFVRSILKIYSLKRNSPRQNYGDVSLIYTEDKSTPFSFLKNIFWNNNIDINSKNGKRILKHELAHVKEKHSQDKLFINLIMILFWCNPIFWYLRKELNLIHEFLADKKAVEDGDTTAFAAMILQTVYPSKNFELTNNFFYSPIKRRLVMLTKNNKTRTTYLSRLLALPVIFFIIAAFAFKTKIKLAEFSSLSNKPLTVVIDAGHGGTDKGAMSSTGQYEKDIVLTLAKKIQALNTNANIKIILTRATDIYQSPQEKAAFAKEARADLFISVHMGSTEMKNTDKLSGLGVYVAKDQYVNSKQSKIFASALVTLFQENFGLEVMPNPQQRQLGVWILQANDFPSVLIEAGFMTHKKDIEYMQTENGIQTFAKNILSAIEAYSSDRNLTRMVGAKEEKLLSIDTIPKNDLIEKDLALFVGNGKIIGSMKDMKSSINLKYVNPIYVKWMKPNEAVAKYGSAAKYGACEMTYDERAKVNNGIYTKSLNNSKQDTETAYALDASEFVTYADDEPHASPVKEFVKPVNLQEPTITLSGISQSKIHISRLKDIKAVELNNPDYRILSATIYFIGKGFTNVVMYSMNSGSLIPQKQFMDKIVAGSTIVFDNVKVINKDGSMMVIKEKSFTFYDNDDDISTMSDTNKIFVKVEHEAEFPGGKAAWRTYLNKNLDVSIPIKEGRPAGNYQVIIRFIVDKNGKVSDVNAENYKDSKMAQACIDLIKNSPAWIPAKQNNLVVTAYKKQPITFVVSEQ